MYFNWKLITMAWARLRLKFTILQVKFLEYGLKICRMLSEVLGTQSCPTLRYSPSGFSVYGILPNKILEWVAIPALQNISLTPGLNRSPITGRNSLFVWAFKKLTRPFRVVFIVKFRKDFINLCSTTTCRVCISLDLTNSQRIYAFLNICWRHIVFICIFHGFGELATFM